MIARITSINLVNAHEINERDAGMMLAEILSLISNLDQLHKSFGISLQRLPTTGQLNCSSEAKCQLWHISCSDPMSRVLVASGPKSLTAEVQVWV